MESLHGRRLSIHKFNGPREFSDLQHNLKRIIDEYQSSMAHRYQEMHLMNEVVRSALDNAIRRFCENLGTGCEQAHKLLREANIALQCIDQDLAIACRDFNSYSNDVLGDLRGGFTRIEEQLSEDGER